MSKFAKFMKANKTVKENEFYAPTTSLCDESGKPIEFEFKHITSKQDELLRSDATTEVPVLGKPNVYKPKFNSNKYAHSLAVASIVTPRFI